MKATENLDTLYLITLMSELGKISEELPSSDRVAKTFRMGDFFDIAHKAANARIRLDQLRVRISKDVLDMGKQEADDSEMPLGTIAAREAYTNG